MEHRPRYSSILHKMGMSYFTRNFIVDIAQRKRELETFLGKFDSGKEKIIQYVSQIDTVGKTDFDPPLLAA